MYASVGLGIYQFGLFFFRVFLSQPYLRQQPVQLPHELLRKAPRYPLCLNDVYPGGLLHGYVCMCGLVRVCVEGVADSSAVQILVLSGPGMVIEVRERSAFADGLVVF